MTPLRGMELKRLLTRGRILAAAGNIISHEDATKLSLNSVARKAGLSCTMVRQFYRDSDEIAFGIIEPVIDDALNYYMGFLTERWPNEDLFSRSRTFTGLYYRFWLENARHFSLICAMSGKRSAGARSCHQKLTTPIVKALTCQMHKSNEDFQFIIGIANSIVSCLDIAVEMQLKVDGLILSSPYDKLDGLNYIEPATQILYLSLKNFREEC